MANNFSGDPNCVGLWKFDNNPNDSIGGNHLTEVNTPTYSTTRKEGTHSIDFEIDQKEYCTRADAALDAGFPGKSGTSEQDFSITGWFKLETLPRLELSNDYIIVSKYGDGTRSYAVYVDNVLDTLVFSVGYNGGANRTEHFHATALVVGRFYHFGVTYTAATNGIKIRIWDDTAGAQHGVNKTGTNDGNMSPDTAPFQIGRYWNDDFTFDGLIDEVVMFTDVLSDADIDAIRAGTYGGWSGKICGVTNPAKINGVAVADITKVNGVS